MVGIDCHIGSQITESGPYLDALERLLDLVEQVEAERHRDRATSTSAAASASPIATRRRPTRRSSIRALLARIDARGHGRRKLLLEPGRSLVGNAGVLVSEVLYLKPGEPKNFCIVDAAMNDLMRPAMYGAWMAHRRMRAARRARRSPGTSWARSASRATGSGSDRALAVAPGDFLAVLSAGAYAMSMASNYNTRGRAAEVMVRRRRLADPRARIDRAT